MAVLKRIDEQYRDNMLQEVDQLEQEPKQTLLATFDFLEGWFKEKSCYGCPFMSAAGEYGEHIGLSHCLTAAWIQPGRSHGT